MECLPQLQTNLSLFTYGPFTLLKDEIKHANDSLEKENTTSQDAKKVLEKIHDFENELHFKESDLMTQEAVYEKQKELLGKDDLTEMHTYQELVDMYRQMNDERHGNEATRSLEMKEREYQDIERHLERLRREANDLNSRKGKLEAEREAHSSVLRARFNIMEEIHKRHKIELDSITQDDDDTFTQGTAASRSTIFTTATSNSNAITQEDMDAFHRALDAKNSELRYEFESTKKQHRFDEDAMQREILELQAKKSAIDNDRKRNDTAKNQAIRELTQISSQMSSGLPRVRKEHVDEARRHAEEIAKTRDAMNNHPRRGEIATEIRVLEDRLKSISTTIEQDSKIRDQLRLRFNEQSEIDMLERQVSQEFDVLNDLVRHNDFLISSQGENPRLTKDDPIAPIEVLANNVRNKMIGAQSDFDRQNSRVGEIQKKVAEKNALLGSHKQRCLSLQLKKNQLLGADGGVQKIKSVIRALVRVERDVIDIDQYNEDTNPTEILKFIASQVATYQDLDEKPEHVAKIMKRLKRMAKKDISCPCCARGFVDEHEIVSCYGIHTNVQSNFS
jgi:hypothetical protein